MTDPNKPDQNVSDDDWADAMSQQEETTSSADAASEEDDPWAAAMAEQEAAEESEEVSAPLSLKHRLQNLQVMMSSAR
ncbi:hypothetical protein HSBAA_01670 [Vreelandella sulfidaeris]|uniref:Flagellar motor switch protein FliN n=1 Tax=Vreelandella sulfidaeris TaxID=115553 RepID=A0A455U305_9GAMM|nr:hypothetical protein HSBAA_01670 [Halomonas sulfidaeris]